MSEEWRVIDGFPDYAVSNFGRVRRETDAFTRDGRRLAQTWVGKILKARPDRNGYLSVDLCAVPGDKQNCFIHVLVCQTFNGSAPTPEHEVAHGDGVRSNNADTNLRWATHEDNCQDAIGHGTARRDQFRGTAHWKCKLSEADVRAIRQLSGAASFREISRKFGVSSQQVHRIISRERWGLRADQHADVAAGTPPRILVSDLPVRVRPSAPWA